MIDQVVIQIISGKGGSGAKSGRREKFVPMGGPDGGDGGDGGNAYIRSDENLNTLLSFRYERRFVAGNGGHGMGRLKHGKRGADIIIRVPEGTQVWQDENPPRLLADLMDAGQRVLIAEGGRGGRGNARFTTSTNQFPLLAEEGEEGEELTLRLELKLLADVGIIGVPNAGKSSLLTAVSAARPKIADYPFTTLEPALGMVERRNEAFVMVDIPGLVEDAHMGVGLGHDFLRHIERTRVLVHLVDGSSEDPIKDYHQINHELRHFGDRLADKPQIVVINKIDLPEVRERLDSLKSELSGENAPLYFVSAATTEGVEPLLDKALLTLKEVRQRDEAESPPKDERELPVLRPRLRKEPPKVSKRNGAYIVVSSDAARIAAMVEQTDWNARIQFYAHLRRMGVIKALEDAGVAPGDTVRIGKVEWEWE